MPIRDFELYHGALLTKLVRSDRPVTLRMIETEADECWSAYTIDDTVTVYTKASGHGKFYEKDNSVKWTFTFQPKHLNDLRRLSEQNDVYIALVCANHSIPRQVPFSLGSYEEEWRRWLELENALRHKLTGICFLEPDEWRRCFDLDDHRTQSIVVELAKGKAFLVNNHLRVAQKALDSWQVRPRARSRRLVCSQP
ncbi:MAG: hypothetical protein A2Z25_16215 [Planctomycetes bacterium RBG_16_55_9]|nr:MAG: hypothetical protein A2Z25_16215 [Planctomycetes bacterium RBG_16_55_9]